MADKVYGIFGTNKCKKEVIPGKIYTIERTVNLTAPLSPGGTIACIVDLSSYIPDGMTIDNSIFVLNVKQKMYTTITSHNSSSNSALFPIIIGESIYPNCYFKDSKNLSVGVGNSGDGTISKIVLEICFLAAGTSYNE